MSLDETLFRAVHGLRRPGLDGVGAFLSRYGYWFPPVAFLVLLLVRKKKGARPAIDGMLAWYAAVTVAEELVKPWVNRARPPHNPALRGFVRMLGSTPPRSSMSFPSGTAAAVFAGATWIWLVLGPRWGAAAMALATLVSLSRVYVGAHYPGDLAGGALAGVVTAFGVWRLCKWAGAPASS